MIKIGNGADGWWFDGLLFYKERPIGRYSDPLNPNDPEARELLAALCARLFNLNRWQGEPSLYGPVSVGYHSLLVAELAARLARVRGLDVETCRRAGAAHDLGEAVILGDVGAPALRGCIDLRALNEGHQRAVEGLLPYPPSGLDASAVASLVKDADHLAAGIERRYLYEDDSRDMESPDVDRLLGELGIESIDAQGAVEGCAYLTAYPPDEGYLVSGYAYHGSLLEILLP